MENSSPATETIRAAHDLTIEHGPAVWRLYNGARRPDQPDTRIALLDATAEQINCAPAFAKARQLPHTALDPADIARVVVGWAPESRNWHLGLLLAAQPDSDYKPRWCGLASWPSGDAAGTMQNAKDAGKALARVINRPFHLIPARTAPPPIHGDTQPVQITRPMKSMAPPVEVAQPAQPGIRVVPDIERVAVKAPPFKFNGWTMQRVPSGYVWKRRSRWVWATVGRAVGYLVLVALYLVLGIGTQTSGIASVNPTWLPWMGLAVALLLSGLAVRQVWLLLTVTDTIIDTAKREIRMRRRFTGRKVLRMPFDAVAYVLVSQPPARQQGIRRQGDHMSIIQNVWLHFSDGEQFYEIAALEEVEGQSRLWDVTRQRQKTAGRRRLRLAHYDTPAHHAARVLADAIDADLWLDIR